MTAPRSRGVGRPANAKAGGSSTRDQLTAAALKLALDVGVDNVTLSGVARLAGYTTPAIYTHFDTRRDLLIAALRMKLGELDLDLGQDPAERIVAWMRHPDPAARRFLVDLYAASLRDDELAELLREFQGVTTQKFLDRGQLDRDRFAALSLLLLGSSFVDAIESLGADDDALHLAIRSMVQALFES